MQEFKINDYLTLRLEDYNTILYVNNRRFDICKFLLLDIHIDKMSSLDEIESIDEAAEELDNSLELFDENEDIESEFQIPPETLFWGHCSNIQVWFENDYDTRLLHRSIAFPLLKKLSDVGDPIAKRVYKEEVIKRLYSGHNTVIEFIMQNGFLTYFNDQELMTLCNDPNCPKQIHDYLIDDKRYEFIIHKIEKAKENKGKGEYFEFLLTSLKGKEGDLVFGYLYDDYFYLDDGDYSSVILKKVKKAFENNNVSEITILFAMEVFNVILDVEDIRLLVNDSNLKFFEILAKVFDINWSKFHNTEDSIIGEAFIRAVKDLFNILYYEIPEVMRDMLLNALENPSYHILHIILTFYFLSDFILNKMSERDKKVLRRNKAKFLSIINENNLNDPDHVFDTL